MQDWSIPLVVAAVAFLAFVLWRVRPFVEWGGRGAHRQAQREAQTRIEAAKSEAERAVVLCDAAEQMRLGEAKGLYQRAMRADPSSAQVVERVVAGLSHRPRALESLLWRRLGATPWTRSREATRAALEALRVLYEGPLRNAVRAKALANARDLLGEPSKDAASVTPAPPPPPPPVEAT
jgi:hypothetical protein